MERKGRREEDRGVKRGCEGEEEREGKGRMTDMGDRGKDKESLEERGLPQVPGE